SQITRDQVSLGSQPQGRPQAASAQIAPATTVRVHPTNATALSRYAKRSRLSEPGSWAMRRPAKLDGRRGDVPPAQAAPAGSTVSNVPTAPAATGTGAATAARASTLRSCRCCRSCSAEAAAATENSPVDAAATETWMPSQ